MDSSWLNWEVKVLLLYLVLRSFTRARIGLLLVLLAVSYACGCKGGDRWRMRMGVGYCIFLVSGM